MISTVRCRLVKLADIFYFRMISVHPLKKPWKQGLQNKKERETGLEPATPTLARSYSTNWATRAYVYYINIPIICKGNTMNLLRKFKYAIFLSSYFTTLVLTKKNMCLQNCLPNAFLINFSYLLVKPSTY